MSTTRKRDDVHEGFLYRVVYRKADTDDEWVHTSLGDTRRPRTYMTLGAARGVASRLNNENDYSARNYRVSRYEYGVQRAPVENWELVE